MKKNIIYFITFLSICMSFNVWAQMEERGLTRTGNELVNDSLFVQAEAEYLKSIDALDFDTNRFNMAFAMMGQEKFDEAIDEWKAVAKSSENKTLQSLCHYNIGGIQVMKKENDKAIESYKQALRFQPKNELARHNYWFLKMVKDQNPQQDQNQDQNSDDSQDGENSDDSKDQQNKENSDKENSDKEKSDKEKSDKEKSDKEKSDEQDSEKDDDADKSNEDEDADKSNEEDDADKSNEDEDADKSNEEDDADKSNEDEDADKSNEEDDADKSNEDEDADKSNEDDDADKSNEDDDADKSNEDEEAKDNQNGESDDESNGEEGEESAGEQPVEGELSKGDAIRLLESLDKEEDKTQKKIKLKLLKGKNNKTNEKDW
ncbi:MAG: hypothetical protein ACPGSD_01595 [Flavobacteriales bacterium]